MSAVVDEVGFGFCAGVGESRAVVSILGSRGSGKVRRLWAVFCFGVGIGESFVFGSIGSVSS